ncbi:MAG: DUF86 domain-containing protein [Candidatus Doudnabacteria bacterium]|nr:DUF86 domain-containing protein [Candidatus Doudnabacteria bacterium]
MLNKDFVLRKIKLIQEDLARLEPLGRFSLAELTKDPVKYAATERLLERIVTRAIDVNRHLLAELGEGSETVRTYEDTFLALAGLSVYSREFAKKIAPSAGLRNILVHEYDNVDVEKIRISAGEALKQYAEYCKFLLDFLVKF